MIWMLGLLSIFFIILLLNREPGIKKGYSESLGTFDGFSSGDMDVNLRDHLENIRHEVRARAYIQKQVKSGDPAKQDGLRVILFNPDDPKIYEKIIYSSARRFWRKMALALLAVYALLVSMVIGHIVDIDLSTEFIKSSLAILANISLIAALVWLYVRSRNDGRIEGFLNGYLTALQDNLVYGLAKEGNARGNDNKQRDVFDNKPPYSRIERLWQ